MDVANGPILNHEVVAGEMAAPRAWIYFLHGIFGAGRNWATIARRLVRARPEYGAVLVDLRQHGGSQGFPPPHTVASAAADVDRLVESSGRAATVLIGHSFGGKVALAYAREHADGLEQLWIIESTPASREQPAGSAWEMLIVLRRLPDRFDSRQAAIDALEREGVARPVAQWVATNLERSHDGYRWRFDLDALEALLLDFFAADLWPVVEQPAGDFALHVVKAAESSVLDADTVRRLERAAAASPRVALHTLPGGHWLNADNPDGLLSLFEAALDDSR